ncbi:MAG: hypothetical protein P4L43_07665 [Syntrophobacteraceae bacterium]|nr:hypothetical protein [Syntrophobacteraceae bacterium]
MTRSRDSGLSLRRFFSTEALDSIVQAKATPHPFEGYHRIGLVVEPGIGDRNILHFEEIVLHKLTDEVFLAPIFGTAKIVEFFSSFSSSCTQSIAFPFRFGGEGM